MTAHALRDYQARALASMRAEIRATKRRLLLVAPTGAGKTTIAAAMARGAHERALNVVAVAHRRELIGQLAGRFRAHGVPVGIVQGDTPADPSAPVQVASIDTLRARGEAPPADLVIVDEAHRTEAKSYKTLLARYPDAVVIGLTATPQRLDGRGLGDTYESLIVVAQPRELIAAGHLVEPELYAPTLPDLTGVRTAGGDYSPAGLAEAMMRPGLVGDIAATWAERCRGYRTLVFAVSVQHSRALAEQFAAVGAMAVHVDGDTPDTQRDDAFSALGAGSIDVVCNVGIATEGLDIPTLEAVVLARPTQSLTVYLQAVGRVLRPHADKRGAVVLDHAGCIVRHGPPTADREWRLTTTEAGRQQAEKAPPVWTCRECYAVAWGPQSRCPSCGALASVRRLVPRAKRGRLVRHDETGAAAECSACGGTEIKSWRPRGYAEGTRAHSCATCGAFLGVTHPDMDRAAKAAEWHRIYTATVRAGHKPGAAVHRFVARFKEPPWSYMTGAQRAAVKGGGRGGA